MNELQGSLLESDNDFKWYVACDTELLTSYLASGVIGVFVREPEQGINEIRESKIRLVTRGFPSDYLSNVRVPVLLEIKRAEANKVFYHSTDSSGKCGPKKLAESFEREAFGAGSIPMSFIANIYFRIEEEKEDYLARAYENVPFDRVPIKVSKELFESLVEHEDYTVSEELENFIQNNNVESNKIFERVDRQLGAAALCAHVLPGRQAWVKCWRKISEFGANEQNGIHTVFSEFAGSEPELMLLRETVDGLLKSDTSQGWLPKQFINQMASITELDQDLKGWAQHCLDLLDNKVDAMTLEDRPESLVRRAVLLLLLRESPMDILEAGNSDLKPGRDVATLAASLSGLRTGLSELPNQIKSSAKVIYEFWSERAAELINTAIFGLENSTVELKFKVETIDAQALSVRLSVFHRSSKLFERPVEISGPLRKAWITALELNLGGELEYDFQEECFFLEVPLKNDRKQFVYLSDVTTTVSAPTVRFWTKVMDISTPNLKKKLTKDVLQELMRRNGLPPSRASFATDPEDNYVICLSDQLSETIDQKEFEEHLRNVAIMGDEREEAITKRDKH